MHPPHHGSFVIMTTVLDNCDKMDKNTENQRATKWFPHHHHKVWIGTVV